ncbi:MAG: hypothetical protein ACI30L_07785 [Muribaculaceae bacterium]
MIKKLLSIAVLAMPLFAANAQESVAKVVFEEDFSLLTTGEPTNPDKENAILNEDGTIKTEYVHKAGWTATEAYSAGGAIWIPNSLSALLLSPAIDASASVDKEVIIEFDAYALNVSGQNGAFIYILHPNATSTELSQFVAQGIGLETWTHVTFSTTAASKPLNKLSDSGVMKFGLKAFYNPVCIKNLKVTINVDPNAGGGEAKDFTGTYSFKGTKEITSSQKTDAWANWPKEEYLFNISRNEGDDADVYPYLVNYFAEAFNTNTNKNVWAPTLKAKPTTDGTSLEMCIGHEYKFQTSQNHVELAGPKGADDTATTLTISPIADSENYTIVDGFQFIMHQEAVDLGFFKTDESWKNQCKFTDIVITRTGDVDAIDSIVADEKAAVAPEGVFTINGAKIRNTNDASDLQPGFYIIGGKKVVIR